MVSFFFLFFLNFVICFDPMESVWTCQIQIQNAFILQETHANVIGYIDLKVKC